MEVSKVSAYPAFRRFAVMIEDEGDDHDGTEPDEPIRRPDEHQAAGHEEHRGVRGFPGMAQFCPMSRHRAIARSTHTIIFCGEYIPRSWQGN